MAELPAPPDNYDQLQLVTADVEPDLLIRLGWADPKTHFQFRRSAQYRFDSPDKSFGVLYAAFDLTTAFAETVLRDNPSKAGVKPEVPLDYKELEDRRVITLGRGAEPRALRLIKLFGNGLAAARTDNRIATVDNYALTQAWAKALHDHPQQADGILYMSRYLGDRKSVALFDRCAKAIQLGVVEPLLAHAGFAALVDEFNLAVDPP